jgi:hypothetical protein
MTKKGSFEFSIWSKIKLNDTLLLFLGEFAKLRKATITFVMSVRPSVCSSMCVSTWNKSTLTGRILKKFDI